MDVSIDSLVGQVRPFYGVEGNRFKWGGNVYEVVEDESDGYRSSLGELRDATQAADLGPFFRTSVAELTMRVGPELGRYEHQCDPDEIWQLVDASGVVWLTFGTENADDYYPSFCFRYTPAGVGA